MVADLIDDPMLGEVFSDARKERLEHRRFVRYPHRARVFDERTCLVHIREVAQQNYGFSLRRVVKEDVNRFRVMVREVRIRPDTEGKSRVFDDERVKGFYCRFGDIIPPDDLICPHSVIRPACPAIVPDLSIGPLDILEHPRILGKTRARDFAGWPRFIQLDVLFDNRTVRSNFSCHVGLLYLKIAWYIYSVNP